MLSERPHTCCPQEAAVGMACLSPCLSSAPAQISVLATYLRLAGDRVWSVRQACAQVGCCAVSCA